MNRGAQQIDKYKDIINAWHARDEADKRINKEIISKIKSKFVNAEYIRKDQFSNRVSFRIGNITLSTLDECETFSITKISGSFAQEELKPILMWATLEDASK